MICSREWLRLSPYTLASHSSTKLEILQDLFSKLLDWGESLTTPNRFRKNGKNNVIAATKTTSCIIQVYDWSKANGENAVVVTGAAVVPASVPSDGASLPSFGASGPAVPPLAAAASSSEGAPVLPSSKRMLQVWNELHGEWSKCIQYS